MARSVDDAFDQLIGWLKRNETETATAASHRQSIYACLDANIGLDAFFRCGSFGHGTSVSGYSDVDYFAVIPAAKLHSNSMQSLNAVASILRKRFPSTTITVDSPAVVVPFGNEVTERHEIIPAYVIEQTARGPVYGIPNRGSGWMRSAPLLHNKWVSDHNDRLHKKHKQVVRLCKAWAMYNRVPIRSFYTEIGTTLYASTETVIVYRLDVRQALKFLLDRNAGPFGDPLQIVGKIEACALSDQVEVVNKLRQAYAAAYAANVATNAAVAFREWDKVFAGNFPAYY